MENPDQKKEDPTKDVHPDVRSPTSEDVTTLLKDTSMSDTESPHPEDMETEDTSHKLGEAIKKGLKKEKEGTELGCGEEDEEDSISSPYEVEDTILEELKKVKAKQALECINEVNEDAMKMMQHSPSLHTLSSERQDPEKGDLVQGEIVRELSEDTLADIQSLTDEKEQKPTRLVYMMRSTLVRLSSRITKMRAKSVDDDAASQVEKSSKSPISGMKESIRSRMKIFGSPKSPSPRKKGCSPSEKKAVGSPKSPSPKMKGPSSSEKKLLGSPKPSTSSWMGRSSPLKSKSAERSPKPSMSPGIKTSGPPEGETSQKPSLTEQKQHSLTKVKVSDYSPKTSASSGTTSSNILRIERFEYSPKPKSSPIKEGNPTSLKRAVRKQKSLKKMETLPVPHTQPHFLEEGSKSPSQAVEWIESDDSDGSNASHQVHSVFDPFEGSYYIFLDPENRIKTDIDNFRTGGDIKYSSILLFGEGIWVIGGSIKNHSSPFVYIYPGGKGPKCWCCSVAALNNRREDHAALNHADRRIYVSGGWSHVRGLLKSCEIYGLMSAEDYILGPQTVDYWLKLCDLNTPRCNHVMVASNDHLYVLGGYIADKYSDDRFVVSNSVEALSLNDPITWKNVKCMLCPRVRFCAAYSQGKIFALGGFYGVHGTDCHILSSVEMYNIDADAWTEIKPMPVPRCGFASTVVKYRIMMKKQKELYVVGGWSAKYKYEKYNYSLNLKNVESDWQSVEPNKMPSYRTMFKQTWYKDDDLLKLLESKKVKPKTLMDRLSSGASTSKAGLSGQVGFSGKAGFSFKNLLKPKKDKTHEAD